MNLNKIILVIITLINLYSCKSYKWEYDPEILEIKYGKPYIREEKYIKAMENYLINEILNGIIYTEEDQNKEGIIKLYGVPIEENIETMPSYEFTYYGVIMTRRLVYNDYTHVFWTFRDGDEGHSLIEINKPFDRLKTINIGDDVYKLKEKFGTTHNLYSNEIIYYNTCGDDEL